MPYKLECSVVPRHIGSGFSDLVKTPSLRDFLTLMTGDIGEEMLSENLRRYWTRGRYLRKTLENLIDFANHMHSFSPEFLETVLDAVEEFSIKDSTNTIHREAVEYLVNHLDSRDLSIALLKRMPDGTYRNIESKPIYIKYLIRYINEMCYLDYWIRHGITQRSLRSRINTRPQENHKVLSVLFQSLARSHIARTTFRENEGLEILGRIEKTSIRLTEFEFLIMHL
ncbi:hypothetical protein ACTXT7_012172 [Hymenolepis weldensis]